MLVRRTALEQIGGMDERFFLYCEDTDLCRRIWDAGLTVRYTPDAVARHVGGASGDRSSLRASWPPAVSPTPASTTRR